MTDKIVNLASSKPQDNNARIKTAAFLRAWADAIESGSEDVTKIVLVLYNDDSQKFRIRIRRHNRTLVDQIGIMTLALNDMCSEAEPK